MIPNIVNNGKNLHIRVRRLLSAVIPAFYIAFLYSCLNSKFLQLQLYEWRQLIIIPGSGNDLLLYDNIGRGGRWYLTINNHIANSHSPTSGNSLQKTKSVTDEQLSPFNKRILIVDDDPDITLTFKKGLEAENENSKGKIFFQVFTYNDPLLALAEFKINFYDLLLLDVNMPKLNGFEFSEKILELDLNARVCYISAGEMNIEALREQYKSLSMGCFIKKPVEIEKFVRRVKAELD